MESVCNLPFERLPVCACDTGETPPTRQQMLECKMRGGPCAGNAPQEPADDHLED